MNENWASSKIFNQLLNNNNNTQNTYWDAISELRRRPNKEVYNQAFKLTDSIIEKEKIIGIYILAQLGYNPKFQQQKTVDLYFNLLKEEKSPKVIIAILSSISHNNNYLNTHQISKLIIYKNHPFSDVRFELVLALSTLEDENAIKTLIELSGDKNHDIRNWATFGLGNQININTQEIRTALWERSNDTDIDTKSEAILGLAIRKDKNIKSLIISELENGDYSSLLFEAIIVLNDKDFLPLLHKALIILKKSKDIITKGWSEVIKGTIEELEDR